MILDKYYFFKDSENNSPLKAYEKLKEIYRDQLIGEAKEGACAYEIGKVFMTAGNNVENNKPNLHIIGNKKGVEKLIEELENEKSFKLKEKDISLEKF